MGWKQTLRGIATITGIKKSGIYIPYKHAASLPTQPSAYAALEKLFEQNTQSLSRVLDAINTETDALNTACHGPLDGHWNGGYFGILDTAATFAIVRQSGARRIYEVGSGSSTHVMCAAISDLATKPEIRCIDPVPRSEITSLGVTWDQNILTADNIAMFAALEPGDIAFFDSSHVLYEGTDVDIIQNRILPILKPGVLVHIHDIFLPDPYPVSWAPRGYTEQTGLGGWLCSNAYEILFSSYYAATRMAPETAKALANLPGDSSTSGGSLWLRRKTP